MPAYVLVSAKGSPGVTTTAAVLAAVAAKVTGTGLLVELDPSGGSVQVLAQGAATTGLVEAAGRLRRDFVRDAVLENATLLPPGVPSLIAPTAGPTAESVVRSLGGQWSMVLRECAPVVVVDAGRWEPGQPSAARVAGADLLVVVCRPSLEGVEHARHIVDPVSQAAQQQAAVVVVGDRPYGAQEVAVHLDALLAGAIAWEPRAAANLWVNGPSRAWLRTRLARSAGGVLEGLAGIVAARQASRELVAGGEVSGGPATRRATAGPGWLSSPAAPAAPPAPHWPPSVGAIPGDLAADRASGPQDAQQVRGDLAPKAREGWS